MHRDGVRRGALPGLPVEHLGFGAANLRKRHAGDPADHRLDHKALITRRALGVSRVDRAARRKYQDRETFFRRIGADRGQSLGRVFGHLEILRIIREFVDEDVRVGEGASVGVDEIGGGPSDPVTLGKLRERRFAACQQQALAAVDLLGYFLNCVKHGSPR